MKSWLKLILQTMKVFILFTGCTILFYYGIMWLSDEYQSYHRYDQPKGNAVKVTANQSDEDYSWFNRFILFYYNGE